MTREEQKHTDYISRIRKELLSIENNAKDIDGLTESQWVAIRAAHRLLGEYIEKEQESINLHDKIEELCSKYPINKYSMSDEELTAYHQGIHLGATKIAEYLSEQKPAEWSEDEWIRKAIIHCILYEPKGAISEATEHPWVKWLEKQKEPDLTEEVKKYKKDFERLRKEHYGQKPSTWDSPIMTDERLCNLIAKCIALGKQKGLVNDDDEIACLDILKRKDRSLSKYDKDMLKIIIGELEQEAEDVNVPRMYEFEINWLKSFFGLC